MHSCVNVCLPVSLSVWTSEFNCPNASLSVHLSVCVRVIYFLRIMFPVLVLALRRWP